MLCLGHLSSQRRREKGGRKVLVARDTMGQEEPQRPLTKERRTFLATLLRARLSKGLSHWVGPGGPGDRGCGHPLLSYAGAFWVCVTTCEGFPQVLAARCVCFLSFQPPVSLGMYRSSYKRDYEWPGESLSDKDMQVPWAFPRLPL